MMGYLKGYTPHTLNMYFWKCIATIIVFINIKGGHHSTDAVPCLFFNNDTAVTTISPVGQSNVALLECAATCCCEKARCCSCDQISGDTFIPCHINTATPVSPLPNIVDSWTETDVPLYEECYNSTTTTPSSTTTEDTTTTITTTSTTEETTDPTTTDPTTSRSTAVPTSTSSSDVRRGPSRGGDSGGLSEGSLIAIACVIVIITLVALVIIIIYCVKRKNQKKMQVEDEPDPEPITARAPPPKSTILAGSALTQDWRQVRQSEYEEPGEINSQKPRQLPPLKLNVPQREFT